MLCPKMLILKVMNGQEFVDLGDGGDVDATALTTFTAFAFSPLSVVMTV